MKLSNKVYDVIKWFATIFLPAALALLVALNSCWGWDLPIEAIAGTVSAIIAFLGAVMSFSTQLGLKDMSYDEYMEKLFIEEKKTKKKKEKEIK